MKYMLVIHCDGCDRQGQGRLQMMQRQGLAVVPPPGWSVRTWPNGGHSVACSRDCAEKITREAAKPKILGPNGKPVVAPEPTEPAPEVQQ